MGGDSSMPSIFIDGREVLSAYPYPIGEKRLEGEAVLSASPEELLTSFIPLVIKVCKRYLSYQNGRFDSQDFFQAGLMAVLEARERYDPEGGMSFVGRAILSIKSRIRAIIGQDPKNGYALKRDDTLSFDQPVSDDGDATLLDAIPDDSIEPNDDRMTRLERAAAVREAVERLKTEEKSIIQDNFFGGKSLEQIASERGITFARVQWVRKKAIRALEEDWILRQKIEPNLRRGTLGSFKRTGSSICEIAVLDLERQFDKLYGSGAYVASFQPTQSAV